MTPRGLDSLTDAHSRIDGVPAGRKRTILARNRWGALLAVTGVVLLALSSLSTLSNASLNAPHAPISVARSSVAATSPTAPSPTGQNNSSGLDCDGVYWASWVWANYSPAWCYGHDEATMSFLSDAAGSGEDANYSFALPADGIYPQADFYATIWFGGVVYDAASLDQQAFLEFQFYPAPPESVGAGSGAEDCLPGGEFTPNFSPGSNEWFACAIVWAVDASSGLEYAAFSGPLDVRGTSSIFVINSNDQVYLNESGVAKSTTQGWQLQVTDGTTDTTGTVSLQNGSRSLPPFYSTAAPGHDLTWGADTPGAVSLAYEIGHSLNPSIPETGYYGACYPGDLECQSYWPSHWAESGQLQLALPVLGSPGSQTYPSEFGVGSSVGAESWINDTVAHDESTCGAPSWSPAENCLYPWYIYRSQNYSFTFDANNETNDTHDYGNWYQFPGNEAVRLHAAPWGTLDSRILPPEARVEFNPMGGTNVVPVLPNDTVYHQFMEGAYWLNVSYPGCVSSSTYVYLGTGAVYNASVFLDCVGLYPATFNETGLPTGTPWSVTFDGFTFPGTGPLIELYAPNGTLSYSLRSPIAGTPGERYAATPANGTVEVLAAAVVQDVSYVSQYLFTGKVSPATAGIVSPATAWFAVSTDVPATVISSGSPLWEFSSWTGVGSGSYTGTGYPAPVVMDGPVQETANFVRIYNVTFTETGLPSNTPWSVRLNVEYLNVTGDAAVFQVANGSFTYLVTGPGAYSVTPQTGFANVTGGNVRVAVQFSIPPPVLIFGLTLVDLELLILLVVALSVAVGVNLAFYFWRRKHPPPRKPYAPEPSPSWLGPPPPR